MKTNNQKALPSGSYKAIDELIEQTNLNRINAKRIKELREQSKEEAIRLYKDRQWQIGKDMPYNNVTLRLYEDMVVTWEKNYQIDDPLLDIYRTRLEHVRLLEQQLSQAKAKLKSASTDLKNAYPDSESIKYVKRLQIR